MVRFGTSGLRGLAIELTDSLVADYTQSFLSCINHGGSLLIGCDLRDSSPRLVSAVAMGCQSVGVTPLNCGALPTPALALASAQMGRPAIMVTGSHIPANRNGLKFYTRHGEITKADEVKITAALNNRQFEKQGTGDIQRSDAALHAYVNRYRDFYSERPLAGMTVGVYQHSSVARDLILDLLSNAGATPIALGRSTSFVPVDTEAIDPETRRMLADWAHSYRLDAIVSTDGDADRPMIVDAQGRIIPGDLIGPIVARSLRAQSVVTPISSNTVVTEAGFFHHIETCKIGSPYVIAAMERLRAEDHLAVAGYEANGGFLLGFRAERRGAALDPLMTRDFALPILEYLSEARRTGRSLSELARTLPPRFTASNRLSDIPHEISSKVLAAIQGQHLDIIPSGHGEIIKTDATDGARFTLSSGRIVHVRPSGNAPELRCYVEAETVELAADLLDQALEKLHITADRLGLAQ